MTNESPLKKYKRQPKLYIDLPSQGNFYHQNALLNGSFSNLPVFSMTASDEILFKTPDALFNGESTANCIKSCIPSILDPWNVPTVDIDTILVAIRMATYGPTLSVTQECPKCKSDNAYDLPLNAYIDHYQGKTYRDRVEIDEFTFFLRPLTYRENTENQKRLMQLRRTINMILTTYKDDEAKKEEMLDATYKEIANLSLDTILKSVKAISVNGEVEEDKVEILEFFESNEAKYFKQIKETIEKNVTEWSNLKHNVKCTSCEAENELSVNLDQSDFFA